MEKTKQKKRKSVPARIWSVFTTILVIAVVLLAIALVGVRVLGYTPYAILSGSMTPKYNVGDLVYSKKTAPADLKVGDAIVFVADENLTLVTHRIVEIDDANGQVYTKGDANDSRDGNPVLYENIVGVVKFSLPKLGYVSDYFTSTRGRYVGICIVLGLVLLCILPEVFKPDKPKEKPEDEEPRQDKRS